MPRSGTPGVSTEILDVMGQPLNFLGVLMVRPRVRLAR